MADDTVRNVFISHVHEDDEGLGKLRDLLTNNGMTIRDGSINADKPNEAQSPAYIKAGPRHGGRGSVRPPMRVIALSPDRLTVGEPRDEVLKRFFGRVRVQR